MHGEAATTVPEDAGNSDVWASDGEGEGDGLADHLTTTEWKSLREVHSNLGYSDGVVKGQNGAVQGGFDQGFATGSQLGLHSGRILGLLHVMQCNKSQLPPTKQLLLEELMQRAKKVVDLENIAADIARVKRGHPQVTKGAMEIDDLLALVMQLLKSFVRE